MSKNEENSSWVGWLRHLLTISPHNKEELLDLLRDTQNRAIITPETLAIVEGAIVFSELRVRDIMLPKKQMACISKHDDFNQIIQKVTQLGHSRYPVTGDNAEEIIGILHAKDLLPFQQHSEDFEVASICRQAAFIPESTHLDSLLREFRLNRNHMAVVVDEYGSIAGFITIEDIIEQIIGDIADEFDIDEESYIKSHEKNRYIIKAHMPIEEFNEQLKAHFSDQMYDTLGGIVMTNFGYLPKRGETVTIDGFVFKIMNADARRIKLLECLDIRNMGVKNKEADGHEE